MEALDDIEKTLSSAFDVKKLLDVFTKVSVALKENQKKIDVASKNISKANNQVDNIPARNPRPGGPVLHTKNTVPIANDAVRDLEAKLAKLDEFIHGNEENGANDPVHRLMKEQAEMKKTEIFRATKDVHESVKTSPKSKPPDVPAIMVDPFRNMMDNSHSRPSSPIPDSAFTTSRDSFMTTAVTTARDTARSALATGRDTGRGSCRSSMGLSARFSDSLVSSRHGTAIDSPFVYEESPTVTQEEIATTPIGKKIDMLVLAGAISKEQLAAVVDPEVQEMFADPNMMQLLQDSKFDTPMAEKALANAQTKEDFMKLLESGLVSKDQIQDIKDPEIQAMVDKLPASLLSEVEEIVQMTARENPAVPVLMIDPDVRQVLRDFTSRPATARQTMSDRPTVRGKIEKLVSVGAILREEVAAIEDPDIQEMFDDPAMMQLLLDCKYDTPTAEKTLKDPTLKENLVTIVLSGLVSRKQVEGIKDPAIRAAVDKQPASLLS
jgi:hypothetical protein